MKYPVQCECGKVQNVPSSLAGTRLPCSCGQEIQIPSLSRLKSSAGQKALTPEVRIDQMIQLGMLPEESNCLICGKTTTHTAYCWAICERIRVKADNSWLSVAAVLVLFGAIFAAVVAAIRPPGEGGKELGRDVRLRIPLRICDQCAPELVDHSTLKRAFSAVPIYNELLDKYPDTELGLEAERKGVTL